MTTNPSTRFQVRRYTSAIGDGWEIWDGFCGDQGGTVLMFVSEDEAVIFAKALNEAQCVVYGGD